MHIIIQDYVEQAKQPSKTPISRDQDSKKTMACEMNEDSYVNIFIFLSILLILIEKKYGYCFLYLFILKYLLNSYILCIYNEIMQGFIEDCFQSDPQLDDTHDIPHMHITSDSRVSKYFLFISEFYIQFLKCCYKWIN